jgi:predicted ATP-grasp superfamily ATP-dependent carboligase
MLLALSDDLVRCNHCVSIALEPSIQAAWEQQPSKLSTLKNLSTHAIPFYADPSIDQIAQQWTEIARGSDRAIVIAPELDGFLAGIIHAMRAGGCHVIAPEDRFIQCASDKWETSRHWSQHMQTAMPTKDPGNDHALIPTQLASQWLDAASSPIQNDAQSEGWVLKRRFGAGGTDMKRFGSTRCLVEHLGNMKELNPWIVQPWITGRPCSLAIVGPEVIGPFEQIFDADSGNYIGGQGPLECHSGRLKAFAKMLVQALPKTSATEALSGWVGIDFLMDPKGRWFPLEVNARLTSSYLGYRRIYGHRLAEAILGQPIPSWTCSGLLNPEAIRFSVKEFHG